MSIIDGIKQNAKTAKWVGLFLVVAGIIAIFAPMVTGISVVLMVGILLIVGGAAQLLLAFKAGSFGSGILVFLVGGLTLLVGLYMMARPGIALATLTLFLAAYFVISGLAEVFSAFGARPAEGWGWLMFGGIVSVLLGVMVWRQFPVSGVWAVGILVGVRLLMSGLTLITVGGAAGSVAASMEDIGGA
jgi:uncharacterized membrane protein HdeD (DUF308 family)